MTESVQKGREPSKESLERARKYYASPFPEAVIAEDDPDVRELAVLLDTIVRETLEEAALSCESGDTGAFMETNIRKSFAAKIRGLAWRGGYFCANCGAFTEAEQLEWSSYCDEEAAKVFDTLQADGMLTDREYFIGYISQTIEDAFQIWRNTQASLPSGEVAGTPVRPLSENSGHFRYSSNGSVSASTGVTIPAQPAAAPAEKGETK